MPAPRLLPTWVPVVMLVAGGLGSVTGCGSSNEPGDAFERCAAALAREPWGTDATVQSTVTGIAPGPNCLIDAQELGTEWLNTIADGRYVFCQTQKFIWLTLSDDGSLQLNHSVVQPFLCSATT